MLNTLFGGIRFISAVILLVVEAGVLGVASADLSLSHWYLD